MGYYSLTRDIVSYKSKPMIKSTNIERFKNAVNSNKFQMNEEIEFIKILLSKYNFISKSEYAKIQGVTPQGVKSRLKANNDIYIEMIGKTFIIN